MEDATAAQLAPFLARYGLVVQLSNSKGRCLIASRAFKQGAEVLAQEPYVAVLDGNSQHKRCDRCFSLSSNLKRCSACKSVFYCCILCQVLSAISFLTQEAPLQALEQQNPFPPPSFCIIIIILLLCK
jgi:hypothetical protein